MAKYKLNYSKLNSDKEVEVLEFTSAFKRANTICDYVVSNPKKVFTLILHYSIEQTELPVYVFHQWVDVKEIVNQRYKMFSLHEWESYEEAYEYALMIKETSPLCYKKD